RPANIIGSDRIDVPCTHSGGFGAFLAAPSEARTMAHAPSDDGHVSRYRIGSHSIGVDSTISREMPGLFRWAYSLRSALCRSLTATSAPMWSGAPDRRL